MSESPLETVFDKAVRPYADGAALRAALPPDTPVILMRKPRDVPAKAREVSDSVTLRVPVLDALRDATIAEWHPAGGFNFDGMERETIGLLVLQGSEGDPALKVVTRGHGKALLVADLAGMMDALAALVGTPAFRAFPGADLLVEALVAGIQSAKKDLLVALQAPDASGTSLLERFRDERVGADRP